MGHNNNVEDRQFNANTDATTRQGNTWVPGESLPEPPPALTGIVVTPETADLTVGGTVELEVDPDPPEAELGEVMGASSDEAVATVDPSLVVTAVAAGTAIITVSSGAVTDTATVTVTAPVEE